MSHKTVQQMNNTLFDGLNSKDTSVGMQKDKINFPGQCMFSRPGTDIYFHYRHIHSFGVLYIMYGT